MKKDSFIMYLSFRDAITELSTEEKGILLDAILEYHSTGEVPEMPKLVKVIFSIMKQQFDRDNEKYQNIIERNRQNISKRWNKTDSKNTTGKSGKITYSDNDTDNDTDDDNDTVSDDDDDDVSDSGAGFAEIANFFQSSSSSFPKVDLNDSFLRQQYYVMLKRHGISKIKEAILRASESWYCTGYNEKASTVTLLWILTPKYFEGLLSKKYENHGQFPEFDKTGMRVTEDQKNSFAVAKAVHSSLSNWSNSKI